MTDRKRPLTADDLLRDLEKDMESAAGNPLLGLFYLHKSMARARALVAETMPCGNTVKCDDLKVEQVSVPLLDLTDSKETLP